MLRECKKAQGGYMHSVHCTQLMMSLINLGEVALGEWIMCFRVYYMYAMCICVVYYVLSICVVF